MGAVAQKYLARAEKELARCGYYEDDLIMVVQMNYTDMPQSWFRASGLEQERLDDLDKMSTAAYRHKWLGDYMDEVDGSIIKGEWFDACIDAHKLERLKTAFEPHGAVVAAHDPFDGGNDAGGFAVRHGSIIKQVRSKSKGEIDTVCDWATSLAKAAKADWFVWDGDGMGTGLKRQVSLAFDGTKTDYYMFKGGLSGKGMDNAEKVYQSEYGDRKSNPKTYADTFRNNRAQYYTNLADRCYNTYRCVVRGEYVDPDEMISFDSAGVEDMAGLRSQLTRIPSIDNPNGLIQLMNKKEMKTNSIESPNEGDSVMMALFMPAAKKKVRKQLNYGKQSIA
jgi:phage terminase large subunit